MLGYVTKLGRPDRSVLCLLASTPGRRIRVGIVLLGLGAAGPGGCAEEPAYRRGAASPPSGVEAASYGQAADPYGNYAYPRQPAPQPPGSMPAEPAAGVAGEAPPDAEGQPATNAPAQEVDPNDADPAALTDFREPLASYGTWEEDPTYGVVWVPSPAAVGSDFVPYVTAGHWGLTDTNEWVWVSDYDWGWAPFHYGRWVWIAGRGWAWIPGRVYSPAWVVWRTGYYDDYYVGWAPMPPSWYWWGGLAFGLWFYPHTHYVFISSGYVFNPHWHEHIVPASRVGVIAPRTRPYISATAAGGGGGYRPLAYAHGPALGEAHVPASAAPARRVAPDSRALSYARPYNPSLSRSAPGGPHPLGSAYANAPWGHPQPGTGLPRSGGPPSSRYALPPYGAPGAAGAHPYNAPGPPRSFSPGAAPRGVSPGTAPHGVSPPSAPHTVSPGAAPRSVSPGAAPHSVSPPSGGGTRPHR